jgi:hypothetical protein
MRRHAEYNFFRLLELHSGLCTAVLEIKIPGCITEMDYPLVIVLRASIEMTAAIQPISRFIGYTANCEWMVADQLHINDSQRLLDSIKN